MEAKEEEFIVTQEWIEKVGAYKDGFQAFKQHFPNGGEALEVLKRCEELDYRDLGEWLVDLLPITYPPLELNNLIGNLFYPNDVHIKGDISTQEFFYIKGSLKVDGKLTVKKYGEVSTNKDFINADEIDLGEYAYLYSQIKANSISLRNSAHIFGNTKANVIKVNGGYLHGDVDADEIINDSGEIQGYVKTIKIENINGGVIKGNINTIKIKNINGGQIHGDVDADEIINDGGLIRGDVNTFTIENINGGRVKGKITYKCSDEHK